jgi:tRNA nucleotidyltransferase/poly(A) polymerase
MFDKIKNILIKIDIFLFKKFGIDKKLYFLENIKEAKEIFSLINKNSNDNEVRFVGGCVRKAINNEEIDDIDLATSLEPNEVKKIFNNNNIRVIETGIDHGTLTLMLNNKKFEITTLRRDIVTDGRHANVKYTTNWEQDALRRDFTINAIYADINGNIFDPQKGILDLESGKIKFIGTPKERIKEDYLRILRYFRFFISYSQFGHDKEIIHTIKQNINGLNKISNERIFDEVKKILSLQNIYKLFFDKQSREIFINIFPQFKFYERLKILENLDKKIRNRYNYSLILALLIIDQTDNYEFFCYKYKVSNKLKDKFKNISKNYENLKNKNFYSTHNIKKLIYFLNKERVIDLLLFSTCVTKNINSDNLESLIDFVNKYQIPKFPISGDYLKNLGYKSGYELGKKLNKIENEWIENNFTLDKKNLEKSLIKNNKN